jgi:hypothetical protein
MFDIDGFKKFRHSKCDLPSGTRLHLANDFQTKKALNIAVDTLFRWLEI